MGVEITFFKILIVSDKKNKTFGTRLFQLLNKYVYDKELKFTLYLEDIEKIESTSFNFDLLLVLNNSVLYQLKIKQKLTYPIVYFCEGKSTDNYPPYFPSLERVIILGDRSNANNFLGIPKEIIMTAVLNINNNKSILLKKNYKKIEIFRIGYALECENILIAKNVIKFFNSRPNYKLLIRANSESIFVLEGLCNSNIKFTNSENLEEDFFLKSDFIMCSGSMAELALKAELPTFIIGSHGLGGLITEENLKDYYRTEFKGRVGGVFNEAIPMRLFEILFNEAVQMVTRKNAEGVKLINNSILYKGSHSESLENIFNVFHNIIMKNIFFKDNDNFGSLHIVVFHNLIYFNSLHDGRRQLIISDKETGQILGALDADEARIFQKCLEGLNINELYSAFPEFDKLEINTFLIELVTSKILNIYYNSM